MAQDLSSNMLRVPWHNAPHFVVGDSRGAIHGSETGLPAKLFSLLHFRFFCSKAILPGLYKGFFAVGHPAFDLKILPTVGSRFSPIRALMGA
jgi:hypothetical protein